MCGIAVFVPSRGPRAGKREVSTMLAQMMGRGDSAPEVADLGLASLGCNRLAIVDAVNGRQPFFNERTDVAVVFNGEIYNHRNLAQELRRAGHQFFSECDTEVIVHGYEEWGDDLLRRLSGMYAFVLVDMRRSRVWAARDPFGIKPLYYAQTSAGLFFASEIKALIRAAETVDMSIVPPGGYVDDGIASDRLLLPQPDLIEPAFEEAKEQIRSRLQRSVSSMLCTELPVAVLCSGGIDSSAVLYEAAQTSANVTAYAIGISEAVPDVRHAAMAARAVGVPFRPVIVQEQDLLRSIPKVIETIESFEPNHIRGGTLSYALAEAIHRDGIKVALCGEGADELFAGYPEFQEHLGRSNAAAHVHEDVERFTGELHKTQLQRVDRTAMAWSLEVRVPFLDLEFATYALSLPPAVKLRRREDAAVIPKWILREAYRRRLPDEIVDRPKVVLSEGAGVGDNSARGPFFEHATRMLCDDDFESIRKEYREFQLTTMEEAYYFQIFRSLFGSLSVAAERPRVNAKPTHPHE